MIKIAYSTQSIFRPIIFLSQVDSSTAGGTWFPSPVQTAPPVLRQDNWLRMGFPQT